MISDLLPSLPLLSAFVVASLILAITPGPAVFYIVTRSVAQGRRSGLASVAGVALGNFGNAVGASLGLAALFAISSAAFLIVKFAGAGYLIYMGVQALRAPVVTIDAPVPPPASLQRLFRDGFVVALLNPKTAIFFAAFLPQFMHAQTAPAGQSVILGALFVLIAASTDSMYAVLAGSIGPHLKQAQSLRSIGRYLTGTAFIGLGLFTALAGSRSK